jgi:hypothetical protein
MKLGKLLTISLMGMLLMVPQLNADVVVNDNFDRSNGDLVGTVPTPGPGGSWTAFSGAGSNPLQISSGQAVVQHGAGSREDAGTGFGASYSSGRIIAEFDITVSDDTIMGGGDYEYFCMFTDGGTSNFYSRLDIVNPPGSGDYSFGIATASATAETLFPTDFGYGQTLHGILTYNFSTGLSSFTIGNTTITSTTSVIANPINTFALRQSTSSNNETVRIDNLVVSAVPEPGSFSLLGLIGLTGLVRRRRK